MNKELGYRAKINFKNKINFLGNSVDNVRRKCMEKRSKKIRSRTGHEGQKGQ
jgi:hypothetical protein